MHVVSYFYCHEQARDPKAHIVFKISPADPVGASVQRSPGSYLDSPQASRCRNEMPDVPRGGCADGQDVRSDQRHCHGRLPQMSYGAWRAHGLLDVPLLAAGELRLQGMPLQRGWKGYMTWLQLRGVDL